MESPISEYSSFHVSPTAEWRMVGECEAAPSSLSKKPRKSRNQLHRNHVLHSTAHGSSAVHPRGKAFLTQRGTALTSRSDVSKAVEHTQTPTHTSRKQGQKRNVLHHSPLAEHGQEGSHGKRVSRSHGQHSVSSVHSSGKNPRRETHLTPVKVTEGDIPALSKLVARAAEAGFLPVGDKSGVGYAYENLKEFLDRPPATDADTEKKDEGVAKQEAPSALVAAVSKDGSLSVLLAAVLQVLVRLKKHMMRNEENAWICEADKEKIHRLHRFFEDSMKYIDKSEPTFLARLYHFLKSSSRLQSDALHALSAELSTTNHEGQSTVWRLPSGTLLVPTIATYPGEHNVAHGKDHVADDGHHVAHAKHHFEHGGHPHVAHGKHNRELGEHHLEHGGHPHVAHGKHNRELGEHHLEHGGHPHVAHDNQHLPTHEGYHTIAYREQEFLYCADPTPADGKKDDSDRGSSKESALAAGEGSVPIGSVHVSPPKNRRSIQELLRYRSFRGNTSESPSPPTYCAAEEEPVLSSILQTDPSDSDAHHEDAVKKKDASPPRHTIAAAGRQSRRSHQHVTHRFVDAAVREPRETEHVDVLREPESAQLPVRFHVVDQTEIPELPLGAFLKGGRFVFGSSSSPENTKSQETNSASTAIASGKTGEGGLITVLSRDMQKAYITRKDKFHPVQRLGPISKRQSNKDGTSEGASADRPHWQEKNDADVHSGASACYTTSEAQKISAIPWETRLYPDKEERKFSEAAWERFLEEKFVGLDPRHRAPEEVARHQMEAFEMGAAAIRGDNDLVPELDKDRPQRGDSSGQSRGGFDATVAGYEAQLERLRGWRKLLTDILQDVGCRKSEAGHDHVQSPEQLWADAIIRIWHWAEAGRGDRGLGSTSGRKMARTPVNTTPIVQTNFYSRVVQNDGRESQSIAEIEQEDLEFYLKWIERVFPEDGKDAGIERSKARHEVHAFETPSGDAKYLDRLLGRLSLPSASTENLIEGGLLVDFGPAAGTGTRKAATQKHHLPQERGGSRQHAPAFHHANKTGHMKTHLSGNSVGGGGTSPQHGMHMKSSSGTDYSPPHAQTSLKNKSTKAPTFDQELALLDLCVRAEVATNPELEAVYADGGLSLGFGQKSQTRRNAFFGRLRDLPERDVVRLLHGRTQKKLLEAEERRRKAIVTGDHHKPMSEQVQTKAREQLTAAMAKLTCEIFAQRALLQALAKELAATAAGTQADVNDFNAKVAKLRAARGGNQVH